MRAAKGGFTLKRVSFTLLGAANGVPTGSNVTVVDSALRSLPLGGLRRVPATVGALVASLLIGRGRFQTSGPSRVGTVALLAN